MVEPGSRLGTGATVHHHGVVMSGVAAGESLEVFPFACVGGVSQDRKHDPNWDEERRPDAASVATVRLGDRCVVREHATIHGGTCFKHRPGVTVLGDGCLIMSGVHVAHDCRLDDNVIIASNTTLGGHVEVGRNAIVGGHSSVLQGVRIGTGAIVGGASAVSGDVVPHSVVFGNRARLRGLNLVGLRRRRTSSTDIRALERVFAYLFPGMEAGATLAGADHIAYGNVSFVLRWNGFFFPVRARLYLPNLDLV